MKAGPRPSTQKARLRRCQAPRSNGLPCWNRVKVMGQRCRKHRTLLLILLSLTTGCESRHEQEMRWERERIEHDRVTWTEPCADKAVLLATTAGSPSEFKCPNQLHRMQVQPITVASKEEAAALVFCRCDQPDGGSRGK